MKPLKCTTIALTASLAMVLPSIAVSAQPAYFAGELSAVKVADDDAPAVDGTTDAVWDRAPGITLTLGETGTITDCSACHAFSSGRSVTLKAVYTVRRLHVRASWRDSTASFTRGGAWTWKDGSWQKLNGDQSEDRIAFFFPINTITGAFPAQGCMAKCHTTDPGSWLDAGRADIWHTKAARAAPVISSTGTGLTVDPATHEVSAGTLNLVGYVDDQYVAQDGGGTDRGRYGDAGTSADAQNRIADATRPKYMESAPVDYADAMVLLQSEIDSGETVGDGATGVDSATAALYWPAYEAFNAIVPERILKVPTGSRGDIEFAATWSEGTWTAELARDLVTGNDDDLQFEVTQQYLFAVATMDNSGGGAGHRVSRNARLTFAPAPHVASVRDVPNDQGGRAMLRWGASPADTNVGTMPYYSVWRALPEGVARIADGRAYRTAKFGTAQRDWEWLADFPALRLSSYAYAAETLYDSMSTTDGLHLFMVVAHTGDPNVFFVSNVASGYSVDNLAPASPALRPAAFASGKVSLSWQPVPDRDLRHYLIYRSSASIADLDGLLPIGATPDTSFVDHSPLSGANYYVVRAQDIHDNLSATSNEVSITPTGINQLALRPSEYALDQNVPNPFNPVTRIRFSLTGESYVSLVIYNPAGQRVRTLVDARSPSGVYEVVWDGRDDSGTNVASGLYLYRLMSDEGARTRRMLLIR